MSIPGTRCTWEFSAFSQNGEDGIIDYLTGLIREPNRYFLEVGASDGLENNTSFLALIKKYNGIMVEGNSARSRYARDDCSSPSASGSSSWIPMSTPRPRRVWSIPAGTAIPISSRWTSTGSTTTSPKAFSTVACVRRSFAVEYNSAFGPEQSVTIPFQPVFDFAEAHPTRLYYGVSLSGWQHFFEDRGYEFVTVDFNGVNAFFVDPGAVETAVLRDIKRLDWQENCSQWARFHCDWRGQSELISGMPLETIDPGEATTVAGSRN